MALTYGWNIVSWIALAVGLFCTLAAFVIASLASNRPRWEYLLFGPLWAGFLWLAHLDVHRLVP